jgi:hypothetical protein
MWSNKYIGIPFLYKGRNIDGIDCWGLARLIYKQEYNIDLPNFSSDYEADDTHRMQDLIAQYREGWEPIDSPTEGCLVLFKIMGIDSHIGIAVSDTHFIHSREGKDSAIESFDSFKWNKRIVGYYKYSENKNSILNVVPHPLRTERFLVPILPGTKLDELHTWIKTEYKISNEIQSNIHILVNGIVIPEDKWAEVTLQLDDRVEYRAVATGGNGGRMFLMLALVLAAPYLANFALSGSIGVGVGAANGVLAGNAFLASAATMAVVVVGSALINVIAPIRPPAEANDPGSSERQLMVQGGANRANPYGAIPVVLGKVRITPPLGAINNLTYENDVESYLTMLLVWGYGPLVVDNSTFKIGDILISGNYEIPKLVTFEGRESKTVYTVPANATTGAAAYQTTAYNEKAAELIAIYGKDLSTVNHNLTLACAGLYNAQLTGDYINQSTLGTYGPWTTASSGSIKYTVDNVAIPISHFTMSFHFPQGLRIIPVEGSSAGVPTAAYVAYETQYKIGTGSWVVWEDTTFGSTGISPWIVNKSYVVGDKVTVGNNNYTATANHISVEGSRPDQEDTPWTYTTGPVGKKDAFTINKTFYLPANTTEQITVRVRRKTGADAEWPKVSGVNEKSQIYGSVTLLQTVFVRNTSPVVIPQNCILAGTALKIKANDQLNGSIEGINAIVQTWAPSWNGTAWVEAATNNPAALFLYVLKHPANPQRVKDADVASKINLQQIQTWYTYCVTKGFEFNSVLASQRSILEVLRDICAAGRASPAMIDGKWTVLIDEPKSNIVQHFTPHNSWGFEGAKALPKFPDGLKITYFDQDQDYQEAEIIIYNTGKSSGNSELFESIVLPGVTKKSLVIDHARWHYAQAKLRPEIYKINCDIEYLVCNRGDRVKVMHDVPLWGTGSGRVKNVISTTVYELDEPVLIDSTKQYTIRFRTETGASVVSNVVMTGVVSGSISQVTIATATSTVKAGDLFMFGEINKEAQDLIILSIEPSANKSALITMMDYGVTDTYNIFTDYLNLSAATIFDSKITLPAENLRSGFKVTDIPTITQIASDYSTAAVFNVNSYGRKISISYTNPQNLTQAIFSVECSYRLNSNNTLAEYKTVSVPYNTGSISILDVAANEVYKIKLRYKTTDGRVSPWTSEVTHTVGQMLNFAVVNSLELDLDGKELVMKPTATLNPDLFNKYEYRIRKDDTGTEDFWDLDTTLASNKIKVVQAAGVGRIDLTEFTTPRISESGVTYRVACRTIDISNKYSLQSALGTIVIKTIQ